MLFPLLRTMSRLGKKRDAEYRNLTERSQTIKSAVPELSFTFGLIVFGALGAVTLKRKLNRIS
jgi:hypothetical protein